MTACVRHGCVALLLPSRLALSAPPAPNTSDANERDAARRGIGDADAGERIKQ